MKRLLSTSLFTLFAVSLVFATEECNFAPTATITNTPTGLSFRDGTQIVFSGTTSTPNNCSGSITEYRWYIEGVYTYGSTETHTFHLPANVHEQSYTVQLRVKNNINLYNTTSITVTITRPQRVYYLKDHIGNVRTSVDVDGNVLGYDDYYPFGLQMDGRSNNSSNPNDDYKFTGHEQDDEASLTMVHMNARGYDPLIGRFNQMDPLMEFSSPYTYVGNNPLNYTDPTGMSSCGAYVAYCGQDGEIYMNAEELEKADEKHAEETGYVSKYFTNQYLQSTGKSSSTSQSQLGMYRGNCEENPEECEEENEGKTKIDLNEVHTGTPPLPGGFIRNPKSILKGWSWLKRLFGSSKGVALKSVDDVFANPQLLKGQSLEAVKKKLGNSSGWVNDVMRKSTTNPEGGWVLREMNKAGTDFTGRLIQYHPGTSRHFNGAPYWKVSSGSGTFRIPVN
ncbi:MAG: hypothetical protein ED557_11905 [Balneola sp.]|nr:MAG: hypothetical protein ED557_11905 [Balneola sp.]